MCEYWSVIRVHHRQSEPTLYNRGIIINKLIEIRTSTATKRYTLITTVLYNIEMLYKSDAKMCFCTLSRPTKVTWLLNLFSYWGLQMFIYFVLRRTKLTCSRRQLLCRYLRAQNNGYHIWNHSLYKKKNIAKTLQNLSIVQNLTSYARSRCNRNNTIPITHFDVHCF